MWKKMNTAVITDKRQDNNMIRNCYNGYRCIINQNIILSMLTASVQHHLCTLNVARATEDSTQLDHRHFTENKTKKHLPTILHLSPRNGWPCNVGTTWLQGHSRFCCDTGWALINWEIWFDHNVFSKITSASFLSNCDWACAKDTTDPVGAGDYSLYLNKTTCLLK